MIRITPILIKEVNKTGDPEKRGENLNKVFIDMRKTLLITTALMLVVGCSESDAQRSRNIIVSDVIEYHDNEGIPKKIRVYDISRDKVALTYKEIMFYRNGQKSAEGTFKDGRLIESSAWDEDGNKQ